MRTGSRSRANQKGIVVIIMSMMLMTVLIPMVGLAIDATTLFLIRGKLSSAVDAAALAGARSLSSGLDLASQTVSAQTTARTFFDANFPPGYWGTSGVNFSSVIAETAFQTRTVTVTGSVNAPLYFMQIFGLNSSIVGANGQASRRDVNVMLVLDRSGSMQNAGVCDDMIASARNFVDKFQNGRDRLGLITFHGSSLLDYAPTKNFKSASPSLDSKISTLACGNGTGSAQALWQGYQQIQAINEPGSLNLIVFFTDGNPTALTANYPVKTVADDRYQYNSPYTALTNYPASPCTSTTAKLGYITLGGTAAFGPTYGVINHVSGPINDTNWQFAADVANCHASTGAPNWGTSANKMRRDISYIPTTDYWGNSTTGYQAVETYPGGHPFVGQIRVDTTTSVQKACKNATDSAASRIRADANLKPVIYAIGLGGTSADPADHDLLNRVANDPNSPIFDPTKPEGMYVYSPTAGQLDYAFNKVASEILRLAK